jgi:hypothetical protein
MAAIGDIDSAKIVEALEALGIHSIVTFGRCSDYIAVGCKTLVRQWQWL